MEHQNPFERDLDRNPANFIALTPLTFLERAATVYPDRIATLHGKQRRTWTETYARCRRLASALRGRGIGIGDTVALMLPNLPEMFEAHFGVPMAGAVLNTLNVRLDAEAIAFMLEHGKAKALLTDREFSGVISEALDRLSVKPMVIDVDDPGFEGGQLLGEIDYEGFLGEGDPDYAWSLPGDEWQAISLNYTSGTTGNPKGVVYHHRGAYLNAVSNILVWNMSTHPVYLWTLPMFHCNGWCFPWTIAAAAGTSVSLRHVRADAIFTALKRDSVTHFCGAPIVLNMLVNAPDSLKQGLADEVKVMTAGSAPPAAILENMVDIKDRSKDIIISGGENISTIEIEDAPYRHPAVLEAAVVARPDEQWGETPCAFVTLKTDAQQTTADEIISFCRERLARFKTPKTVVFGELPKTSTGKIQKYVLRNRAKEL